MWTCQICNDLQGARGILRLPIKMYKWHMQNISDISNFYARQGPAAHSRKRWMMSLATDNRSSHCAFGTCVTSELAYSVLLAAIVHY